MIDFRKFSSCLAAVLTLFSLSCQTSRSGEIPPSEIKAETDDTETERTLKLVDVSLLLEAHVNFVLETVRKDFPENIWTPELREKFLRAVYDSLGAYKLGTGIEIAGIETSLKPEIVYWISHTLDPSKEEILQLSFKETKYGRNVIGVGVGKVISHWTQEGADKSIAPVLRVGKTLLGSDKIGHFFMQGYWYWQAELHSLRGRCEFGQYMEGNSVLFREKWRKYYKIASRWIPEGMFSGFRFGYFGAWSTGVISYADGESNEAGYQFFQHLYNDPSNYKFSFSDYLGHLSLMNEGYNPNKYAHGILVDEEAVLARATRDSCWEFDRNRTHREVENLDTMDTLWYEYQDDSFLNEQRQ